MIQATVAATQSQPAVGFVFDAQPRRNSKKPLPAKATATRPVSGPLSEEALLVARAKSGHNDAFGELYQRHQRRAYRTAFRILRNQQDAEDAVQRAFQRVLTNLQTFREDSTFSTWLTRIVVNDALMLLRQRRLREPVQENSLDAAEDLPEVQIADGRPTPEETFCERERRETVHQAIGELRESLRVVLLRGELQGLTSAETARHLGLTVSAVKARTFHARRFLRKRLAPHFGRPGVLRALAPRQARRA
jgi:RNA polymerase sigma-70 factor, ECF subfamily